MTLQQLMINIRSVTLIIVDTELILIESHNLSKYFADNFTLLTSKRSDYSTIRSKVCLVS